MKVIAQVPPRCGVGGIMIWVLFSKPYIYPRCRLFKVSSSIKPWRHQVCNLTWIQSAGVRHPRIGVLTYIVLLLSLDEWLTLILEFPPPHYLLANEADEGLKYKGRKAAVVTTATTKFPLWKESSWDRLHKQCESRGLLQGDIFGRRKNLQSGKAKTSVTAEVCRYTQVRKSDPDLGTLCFFFKLAGKGRGKPTKKSLLKGLSSSICMVNIMPMFINPRILKR